MSICGSNVNLAKLAPVSTYYCQMSSPNLDPLNPNLDRSKPNACKTQLTLTLASDDDEADRSRVWRKGQMSCFPKSRSFAASLSRAFMPWTRETCCRNRACILVWRCSFFITASFHCLGWRPLSNAMQRGHGSTTSTEGINGENVAVRKRETEKERREEEKKSECQIVSCLSIRSLTLYLQSDCIHILSMWSDCLFVVWLSICGLTVYLWSDCICGPTVYLWSDCLFVVRLSIYGQTVYL